MSARPTELTIHLPALPGALCRDAPEDLWHAPDVEGSVNNWRHRVEQLSPPRFAAAVAVCAQCPERAPCAAYGIAGDEDGIWGGLTREQRRTLAGGTA